MQKKHFNIAIDGPAGAGKSTVARMAAEKLNFIYVDTGAMYRAVALYMLENGINVKDEAAVSEKVKEVHITLRYEAGLQQVLLSGEDVSGRIRTEEAGNAASAVSAYPAVRSHLLNLQRELAAKNSVIMDGRDIGTCILPKADVKIFLTANPRARALRRYHELTAKGERCNLQEIEQDITERDQRDMNRAAAPLKQAPDAILVDSSEMTAGEVAAAVVAAAVSRGLEAERQIWR